MSNQIEPSTNDHEVEQIIKGISKNQKQVFGEELEMPSEEKRGVKIIEPNLGIDEYEVSDWVNENMSKLSRAVLENFDYSTND